MAVWHGTTDESDDLMKAINHFCTCQFEEVTGAKVTVCDGHKMMVDDQRTMDRLLFYRRTADSLRRMEGIT